MARLRNAVLLTFVAAFTAACASAPPAAVAPPQPSRPAGVVAADVRAGSALARAGVQNGDVLLSWARGSESGRFDDPFAVREVLVEQLPLGGVTVTFSRNGETQTATVGSGYVRGTFRPQMTEETLAAYREARAPEKEKRFDAAAANLRALADAVAARDGELLAVWLLKDWADTVALGTDAAAAAAAYDEAIARAKQARLDAAVVQLTDAKAAALARRNDMANAEKAYREVLAMRRAAAPESFAVVAALNALGDFLARRRDIPGAEAAYREALSIAERRAPLSVDTAHSLNALARAAFFRGDIPAAETFFQRSLEVQEKVAPGGYEHASNLNGLGVAAFQRGDLAAAEGYWKRALEMMEKIIPDGAEIASILNNVAAVAKERGDYASADRHMRRVLAIQEKLLPNSLEVAQSLNNLGNLALTRKELDEADDLLERSLELRRKLAPESLDTAHTLNNLGDLALTRGRHDVAQQYFEQALALHGKIAPGSVDAARDYNDLAALALERGDAATAQQHLRSALAILEQRAPSGLDAAFTLHNAGSAAHLLRDYAGAERDLRRALDIREQLAPGSKPMAETLYRLGLLARDRRRLAEAAELLRRAIDTIESQGERLGGSEETKSGFLAGYQHYYRELIGVLLQLDRRDEAFHVLERSRAQRLLAMLAERDLVFTDVPDALERERKSLDRDYDKAQQSLAGLNPAADGEKIEQLRSQLRDLRARRQDLIQRIRRESPRVAALKYPQPLDVAMASRSLDRGTVLLSYVMGEKSAALFIVESHADAGARSPLTVVRIAATEESLRRDIRRFRSLIERGATSEEATELKRRASELSALLLPRHRAIGRASRLLVSPDGPLHMLPFAALASPDARGRFAYLAEQKPVHVVLSGTVYAELLKERTRPMPDGAVTLVAFGDPRYPGTDRPATDPAVRSLVTRYGLQPLPATREEVVKIASLFGDSALHYLGDAAREETAKQVSGRARYLHFASHAFVDEDFPLDSALALSIPDGQSGGGDNGLLQAWEIFESVRVRADLVVLSACETALGKPTGGEGLVGLTRAFQYAGARSVLASLWSVSDTSTARLMEAFYAELRGGKSKADALRSAQLSLLREANGEAAHPYHWAAFQLVGDWQ